MSLRKLEPGDLIDPSKKHGSNMRSFMCNTNSDGEIFLSHHNETDVYAIIESPEPVERDWGDVVREIQQLAILVYGGGGHFSVSFPERCLEILQQTDKPKTDPVTVKMWVNVYNGGNYWQSYKTRETADNADKDIKGLGRRGRIACVELDISYEIGEGLNDQ